MNLIKILTDAGQLLTIAAVGLRMSGDEELAEKAKELMIETASLLNKVTAARLR